MADRPDAQLETRVNEARTMTLALAQYNRRDQCRIILMIAVALGLPIKFEAHDHGE